MADILKPLEDLKAKYPEFIGELSELVNKGRFELVEAKGWVDKLVDASRKGPMYCGDGRVVESGVKAEEASKSPKIFGGTLGIAVLLAYQDGRTEITKADVLEAKKMIEDAGYVAGVHDLSGHDDWGKVHCGFAGLIGRGELGEFRFADEVTIEWVVETMGKENQVKLKGEHQESKLIINLGHSGKTLEPNGSSFVLDPWVLREMGFENEQIDWLLRLSLEVVTALDKSENVKEVVLIR